MLVRSDDGAWQSEVEYQSLNHFIGFVGEDMDAFEQVDLMMTSSKDPLEQQEKSVNNGGM